MLTHSELKYYSSLLKKKTRYEERKFLAEGKRLVSEALGSGYSCEAVFTHFEFAENNPDIISFVEGKSLRLEILHYKEFVKLCDTETPQGLTGVFAMPDTGVQDLFSQPMICALENISDPGNLGTIIRNCDWFGVNGMIISGGSADLYSPKTVRSTMGSMFHIKVMQTDSFYTDLSLLKDNGYEIVCSDMNGENIYGLKPSSRSVIAFSSEAFGPSGDLLALSDRIVTIPRIGKAESLNVANASAVILSHLTSGI